MQVDQAGCAPELIVESPPRFLASHRSRAQVCRRPLAFYRTARYDHRALEQTPGIRCQGSAENLTRQGQGSPSRACGRLMMPRGILVSDEGNYSR